MSAGQQLVQTVHAGTTFAHEHPHLHDKWIKESNTLASLSVANEQELLQIYRTLEKAGAVITLFREPDRKNEATSLAFYGTPELRSITSGLESALKSKPSKVMV